MSNKELFDTATHIYTRLRRLSSRTVDVIWMVHNAEYAREVLRLARTTGDAETLRLVERYEQLAFGTAPRTVAMPRPPEPAQDTAADSHDAPTDVRYVGALR